MNTHIVYIVYIYHQTLLVLAVDLGVEDIPAPEATTSTRLTLTTKVRAFQTPSKPRSP